MRNAGPIDQGGLRPEAAAVQQALGTHTRVSRVQGSRLKAKREIRVASVFRQAPAPFLKMIVVHELAHLKHAEHDKAFYALCTHMEPDYHQLEFDLRLWLCGLEPRPLPHRRACDRPAPGQPACALNAARRHASLHAQPGCRRRPGPTAQPSLAQLKALKRQLIERHVRPDDLPRPGRGAADAAADRARWRVASWPSARLSYALTAAITLLTSLFLLRAFVLMHECGHGSLFRSGTAQPRLRLRARRALPACRSTSGRSTISSTTPTTATGTATAAR